MAYRFETAKVVEGVPYEAGAVVLSKDIPAGCAESMLALKEIVEVDDPPKKKTTPEDKPADEGQKSEAKTKK